MLPVNCRKEQVPVRIEGDVSLITSFWFDFDFFTLDPEQPIDHGLDL
jgi:hypothetical protein